MTDPKRASGSVTPNLPNRIRVNYPRRNTVQLGDLDAVFEPVTSVLGKKQRLQAFGHYYEPITPATGDVPTEAYRNCLTYWQAKRERLLNHSLSGATPEAALETELQTEIRRFIVGDGVLPVKRSEVKIRLPGALTFDESHDLGSDDSAAPSFRRPLCATPHRTRPMRRPRAPHLPRPAMMHRSHDAATSWASTP